MSVRGRLILEPQQDQPQEEADHGIDDPSTSHAGFL
jgi:hypothetical protein